MAVRMRFLSLILLNMFLVASAIEANAQVNTEKMRKDKPVEGFAGFLSSSLALTQGNTNRLRVDGGFRAQYQTLQDVFLSDSSSVATKKASENLFFIVGQLTFAEKSTSSGNEVYINKSFAHARWTRMWWPRLGSEVFTQLQQNQTIRLQFRALAGIAARLVLVESEWADVYLGSGYMYEHEELDVAAPNELSRGHRWTNYLSFSIKLLDGKVGLINSGYAQPRFNDFKDYRIINESTINFSVHDHLSVGLACTLRYDSAPPPEVLEKLDLKLTNTIKLTF